MRVTVLVNRGSGTVKKKKLTAQSLREMFREAGVEADVRLLPGRQIQEAARDAVKEGTEAVVAGGGDGTIRSVAAVLIGGKVPLGVLPLGTMNHFAVDLKIPNDLAGAVKVIAEGSAQAIDVGEVNGEIFLNNSSIGFYPPIVQARDQEMRHSKLNKWVAMAVATFKLMPKLSPLHLRISSGDWQVDRKTEVLFVGNSEYRMSALDHGAPGRLEGDGFLCVYVAHTGSRLALFGLALAGLFRDVKQTRSVEDWKLRELRVDIRQTRAIPVSFDGEVSTLRSPLLFRKRVGDLRVIAPPPEPP
ncbi:MAG TPA: diacylglycerol kinase family protein [Thermoanaerobaculia bacterium]|jgi:diacylglycerol kinase family enzyme|nr:diacylglycerol kinase family protein [Thermoanaerobaculia bacterium]